MAVTNTPSSPNACPDREALSAFYLGKLPGGSLQAVADHLDRCPGCHSRLEALEDGGDVLIAGLRDSVSEGSFSEEPACRQVLRQLQQLDPANEPAPAALGQLGQYQLLERLGQGGMGVVYRALHLRLKRIVALKVLAAGRVDNPAAVARFQREMEAVGQLDHPHIVRASDAGEVDGTHFLVMEFLDGLDLARLVKGHGPLPPADACELIRQAALGLQHAHEHGLVHRDVKPSNLILDRGGRVKVLDLGLARLQTERPVPENLTAAGQVLGTFDYMAPEQGDDTHSVDIRADIYSLGCTLYFLLAGRPPFSGPQYTTFRGKLWAHARAPVPPLPPALPPALTAVVERMLAKDPAARFATPAEVAEALAPFTAGHDLSSLLTRACPEEAAEVQQGSPLAGTDNPLASALVGTHPGQERPAREVATQPQRVVWKGRRAALATAALLLVLLGTALVFSQVFRERNQDTRPQPEPIAQEGPEAQVAAAGGDRATVPQAAASRPQVYTAALFTFEERGSGTKEMGAKVTDLLYASLGSRSDLYLVEREDLKRALGEAELGLSGAVKPGEAARVGQLTGARILLTGSVLAADKKLYLVARITGVENSRVLTASVDGQMSDDLGGLTDKLADKVADLIKKDADKLAAKPASNEDRLEALAGKLKKGNRPVVQVRISEHQVGAAPRDPAAQTELVRFLKGCGFEVVDAEESPRGAADVLVQGEGLSEVAAHRGELVSVKARVELKAVERKSGRVLAADRQTAVVVDLGEQLAGKEALQEAAATLAERLLPKLIPD